MATTSSEASSNIIPGGSEEREILSTVAKKLDKLEWVNKSMMIPHEPIRSDLRSMKEIVTLENFSTTQRWKAPVFFDWYDRFFYPIVHAHHDVEEKMLFPWVCEKAELPPRFSEDHVDLLERLDTIKGQRKTFQDLIEQTDDEGTWNEAVSKLHQDLLELEKFMVEHMDEEEEIVPPALEKHFTLEEHDAKVGEFFKTVPFEDAANMVPWVVDRMYYWGGEAEVKTFLNTMPLPPRLLYKFFWKSTYERDNRGAPKDLRSDAAINPQTANAFCLGRMFK